MVVSQHNLTGSYGRDLSSVHIWQWCWCSLIVMAVWWKWLWFSHGNKMWQFVYIAYRIDTCAGSCTVIHLQENTYTWQACDSVLRLSETTLKMFWETCDSVSDMLSLTFWQAAGIWWCTVLLFLCIKPKHRRLQALVCSQPGLDQKQKGAKSVFLPCAWTTSTGSVLSSYTGPSPALMHRCTHLSLISDARLPACFFWSPPKHTTTTGVWNKQTYRFVRAALWHTQHPLLQPVSSLLFSTCCTMVGHRPRDQSLSYINASII